MKRILSLILVMLLVAGSASAADLSEYPLRELQLAAASLRLEILKRQEAFIIYQGVYIVGADIPAGIYRVELKRGSIVGFDLYRTDGLFAFTGFLSDDPDIADRVIGRVELEDGQRLELTGTVTFYPYAGVMP